MPSAASIERASQLYAAGRSGEALRLFHALLADDPQDLRLLLGIAGCRYAVAGSRACLAWIDRALAIHPEAEIPHRNGIALARSLGDAAETARRLERALAWSDALDLHYLQAETRRLGGDLRGAAEAYRAILSREPDEAAAANLGAVLNAMGQYAEAASVLQRAAALSPQSFSLHQNLAFSCLELRDFAAARRQASAAVALAPLSAEAHVNLGAAAEAGDDLLLAQRAPRCALALQPGLAAAATALGKHHAGRLALVDAVRFLRRAIAIAAGDPDVAVALSHAYLIQGDGRRGWRLYENRPGQQPLPIRRWRGEPLDGARILLHAEQGAGDTLHFVRHAADVAALGGKVTVRCPASLVRLLKRVRGVDQAIVDTDGTGQDWQCPLPSLPAVLGERAARTPTAPYLDADPSAAARWRRRLSTMPRPWIGICWRGNPGFRDDRRRSPGLDPLGPILKAADGHIVSLTKAPDPADPVARWPMLDLARDLADFDETAALVASLDLVISSDTAVAHLAGGLGRPLWLLLAYSPDWRWLLGRTDSPLYRTARLYRQPAPGDWGGVAEAVAGNLGRFLVRNSVGDI